MAVTKITDNFTLEELTRSSRASELNIDNSVKSHDVLIALTKLCVMILQPIRDRFGEPVIISSGYRCPALNEAVGGVAKSQHCLGQAADIYLGGDTALEEVYFRWIRKNLDFDQLILEGNQHTSWIHVSYNSHKKNRRQSWMQLQKTSGA